MNAVLGGLFNSRINLNLREVHGYTYGAFSGFDWRRQAGPFVVSTAVQADVTAAAAREMLLEIDRMRATPVAPRRAVARDELSRRRVPDSLRDDRRRSRRALAVLVVTGCPRTTTTAIATNVRAVTAEQVLAAARTHLHPDALQMVVVGDARRSRARRSRRWSSGP